MSFTTIRVQVVRKLHPEYPKDPLLVHCYFCCISMICQEFPIFYFSFYSRMIQICSSLENVLVVDKEKISMSNHTKFMRVMVDSHLSYESHINHIKGKISRGIGILYQQKKNNKKIPHRLSTVDHVLCIHLSVLYILYYRMGKHLLICSWTFDKSTETCGSTNYRIG